MTWVFPSVWNAHNRTSGNCCPKQERRNYWALSCCTPILARPFFLAAALRNAFGPFIVAFVCVVHLPSVRSAAAAYVLLVPEAHIRSSAKHPTNVLACMACVRATSTPPELEHPWNTHLLTPLDPVGGTHKLPMAASAAERDTPHCCPNTCHPPAVFSAKLRTLMLGTLQETSILKSTKW